MPAWLRADFALLVAVVSAVLFFTILSGPLKAPAGSLMILFFMVWLIGAILYAAFGVVHHADRIAGILGEPVGTLVLTLTVTVIEVSIISAVMFTGSPNPGFARDTMFAVVMLILNGLVGLSILMGGLVHREQTYRLESGQAFLGVIIPLAVIVLILPNFTHSTADASLSGLQMIFLAVVSLLLFGVFLALQTVRHRDYFREASEAPEETGPGTATRSEAGQYPLPVHCGLLLAYLIPIVLLAEKLGYPLDMTVSNLGAPQALAGTLVAAMILCPEGLSALVAALRNRMQRSVNLLLGSVLASIALTIPAVIGVAWIRDYHLVLGLNSANSILLALTLVTSMLTFFSGKTNILFGAIHLVLFVAYLVLIFD